MIIIIMYFSAKVESIANANEMEENIYSRRRQWLVVGLYTAQCAMCTVELFTIVWLMDFSLFCQ